MLVQRQHQFQCDEFGTRRATSLECFRALQENGPERDRNLNPCSVRVSAAVSIFLATICTLDFLILPTPVASSSGDSRCTSIFTMSAQSMRSALFRAMLEVIQGDPIALAPQPHQTIQKSRIRISPAFTSMTIRSGASGSSRPNASMLAGKLMNAGGVSDQPREPDVQSRASDDVRGGLHCILDDGPVLSFRSVQEFVRDDFQCRVENGLPGHQHRRQQHRHGVFYQACTARFLVV